MVTESTSGYILNLEIYAGEGKKLQETIFTLLEPYLDQNYCALFNSFRMYQKLNPTSQMRYKEFLLQVAKDWATDKVETDSDTQHTQEHQPKPLVCLMRTPLGDFRVICTNMC